MPAAVVLTSTPTSTVSIQLTATSADWPMARGAVNAQKSTAIARLGGRGFSPRLAAARRTRFCIARAEKHSATTVVAAHAALLTPGQKQSLRGLAASTR